MGRSQETNKKKEVQKNKQKKKKAKEKKKQVKKEENKPSSLDDMIAYVNEDGTISSTPPEQNDDEEIDPQDIEISVPKQNNQPEDPSRKGTVTFFNERKGYGFIRDIKNGNSVFVHANGLLEEIAEGNLVTFEVEKGRKGPNAVKVKQAK
ncbi:MAG: cold shock domain-containing protein [Bacteroidales bacterium]